MSFQYQPDDSLHSHFISRLRMCFGAGSSHQPQCLGGPERSITDGRYFCGALLLPLEWRLTPPTRCSFAWGPHPSRTSDRSCPWCGRQTRPPSSPRSSTRTSLKARIAPFQIHRCSPAQHLWNQTRQLDSVIQHLDQWHNTIMLVGLLLHSFTRGHNHHIDSVFQNTNDRDIKKTKDARRSDVALFPPAV